MSDWQKFLIALLIPSAGLAAYFLKDKMSDSTKIREYMPTAQAECSNLPKPAPQMNETATPTTVISMGTVTVGGYIYLCNLLKNQQVLVVAPIEKGIPPPKTSKE
jgi:hypothetical protein